MEGYSNLVLSFAPGDMLIFKVDKPCTFAVMRHSSKDRRVLIHSPAVVDVARGVTAPDIAAEMLASIEARKAA